MNLGPIGGNSRALISKLGGVVQIQFLVYWGSVNLVECSRNALYGLEIRGMI
jgi:hypothetical protein